jgi:hypothetical protein
MVCAGFSAAKIKSYGEALSFRVKVSYIYICGVARRRADG